MNRDKIDMIDVCDPVLQEAHMYRQVLFAVIYYWGKLTKYYVWQSILRLGNFSMMNYVWKVVNFGMQPHIEFWVNKIFF